MSFIRIDDVVYRYPTQHGDPALRGVSCRVDRGQFVGVTGPADAGKTTLCRLIAGYVPHFFGGELSGQVSVGGIDPTDVPLSELVGRVGYVFENPFDQLTGASQTVFEEVAFALENLGLPRAEIHQRVERSLAQAGITDLSARHPGRLSGGQSQRLAIAALLAIRPEVLILDEPTSQLDPLGAEEVLAVVADLRAAGYTVVVVTQDLQRFAAQLDWLLVMQEGVVRHQGPPRESLAAAAPSTIRLPVAVELGERHQYDRVVLVTIDTLRADHVGAYRALGEGPSATPHLDRLAREALLFEDATANAPYTLPAHATLLSGQFPGVHGVEDRDRRLSPRRLPSSRKPLRSNLETPGATR